MSALNKYQRLAAWHAYTLGETRRVMMQIIADKENEAQGTGCTLSIASFSRLLAVSERMVQKHIGWLETNGAVRMRRSRGKNRHEIWVQEPNERTKIQPRNVDRMVGSDIANGEPQEFTVEASETVNPGALNGELQGLPTVNPRSSPNTLADTLEAPGRPSRAGPVARAAAVDRLVDPEEDLAIPTTVVPVETEAAWRAASVPRAGNPDTSASVEPLHVDAEEEPFRPTDAVPPSASAPSIDDDADDYALSSPFDVACDDEEEDDEDMSWLDAPSAPSRTPVQDAFREELNEMPRSLAELRAFAREHELQLSSAEIDELADDFEEDDEGEIPSAGRLPDADDLDRLRRGAKVDRHGRPFDIEKDGCAYKMLSDDIRRAAYVGWRCDRLFALRPSERPGSWKETCVEMHELLRTEGYGTGVYDRLIEPLSAEITAEMSRRVSIFHRHFLEASS